MRETEIDCVREMREESVCVRETEIEVRSVCVRETEIEGVCECECVRETEIEGG